jgi:hypothetical protein
MLLGELSEDGQELVVARGGRGGRGNSAMPSKPHGPASKHRQDGGPGQRRVLLLETRLLADVVLVGLPNVGKSSLVAALTGARAQVQPLGGALFGGGLLADSGLDRAAGCGRERRGRSSRLIPATARNAVAFACEQSPRGGHIAPC